MLSRTADSLFWLARYMERAENTARLVDMGRRMGAIPGAGPDCLAGRRSEWPAILAATGCTAGYNAKRTTEPYAALDEVTATLRYLLLEPENPASVRSSFEAARANARAVRAALNLQMWESVNEAWIAFRMLRTEDLLKGGLSPQLEMIKTSAAQFLGAIEGAALRNDGYQFLQLGFAVERLDCTARLLDVKVAGRAQRSEPPATADEMAERHRLVAVLRAAGQMLAYRAQCRSDYTRDEVTNFLIRRRESPRSLLYAAMRIEGHLRALEELYEAPAACMPEAKALIQTIRDAPLDRLDKGELHRFLAEVIAANGALSAGIAASYHFGPAPAQPTEMQAAAIASREGGRVGNAKSKPIRRGQSQVQL
ncbi:MAG: alpha-E domain-containing protein [Pseudomonadota bacterium]